MKWNDPGTIVYEGSGLDALEITDVEDGDGVSPNDGFHAEFGSQNAESIGVMEPCKIYRNETRGIYIKAEGGADSPTVSIKGCEIYDNGLSTKDTDCAIWLESVNRYFRDITIEDNDIYNMLLGECDYGIRLLTEEGSSEVPTTRLSATTRMNKIHGMKKDGIYIRGEYTGSWGDGGGLVLYAYNDRIYSNGGNGIYIDYPYPDQCCMILRINLYHETICSNVGHGIWFDHDNPASGQYVKGYNCIFYDNGEDVDDEDWPGFPSVFWNCFWCTGLGESNPPYRQGGVYYDPLTCLGDLTADPEFDTTGPYHLKDTSVCIDKGDYSKSNGLSFDMEGDRRNIDGDGDQEEETDMGADEYDPAG